MLDTASPRSEYHDRNHIMQSKPDLSPTTQQPQQIPQTSEGESISQAEPPPPQIAESEREIPAPPTPLEPKEASAWRLEGDTVQSTQERQLSARIGKPASTEWSFTFPDKAQWTQCYLYRCAGSGRDNEYIVTPQMEPKMPDVLKRVMLVPWQNVDGIVAFWPVTVPSPDRRSEWHISALAIAERAMTGWIRMTSIMSAGLYRAVLPENPRPEPQWPDPARLNELLEAAVKDRLIDSEDHPIFREFVMR